ncbi:uncharacterized protein B0H64DRAFT_366921 [Chaetomium fimeti]|jgi:hypothetical protein|uniref:Uncharacterized protein n=1 Tax=Chaetomium fimeti TaxID=1854472 RepID=A0AAE0H7U3_9PEZI|nr:hypothetical protein B0H64DRAFT_366921 [Chaetomium fimeti]
MKFEALLAAAWLAATTTAIGPATPDQPPRLRGKPERMANWPWPNPFKSAELAKFTPACDVLRTFRAQEFMLDDLAAKAPKGLLEYRDALKDVFAAREYPGSWDGIDPHGYDRDLLTMDYNDVPLRVREWIEDQERTDGPGKGLFAVYQRPLPGTRVLHTIKVPKETPVTEEWRARDEIRVALFAPGALYEVLPLWVVEGSKCEGPLLDLSKYSSKLVDGGVIAYPIHHSFPKRAQGKREIEFQIQAQVLQLNEGETLETEQAENVEEAEKVEKAEKVEETESTEKEEL